MTLGTTLATKLREVAELISEQSSTLSLKGLAACTVSPFLRIFDDNIMTPVMAHSIK